MVKLISGHKCLKWEVDGMKLLKKDRGKQQAGFTLVELMVTIVLTGMVLGLAGIFFNFSFMSERKIESEFDLQASMRHASEVLNNSIRKASVTFTLTEDVFDEDKKDKWNYFGVENGNEIVQYNWNSVTDTHDKKVLLEAEEGITYKLYFKVIDSSKKLIQFNLECIKEGEDSKKIAVETMLSALNSVAVDEGGSIDNPAAAIAFRSDPTPNPEVITTQTEVNIVVALVLDDSGSMDEDMAGRSPGSWGFDTSNVRKTIMKSKANDLLDKFAEGNFKVSLIPFATNADRAGSVLDCASNLASLKTTVNGLNASGGTNTGDSLRRAYYKLKDFKTAHSSEDSVFYIILLTDGNPTYRSSTNYWTYQPQTSDGNCIYVNGTGSDGSSENINNCMDYVTTIGQTLVVGQSMDIKTFVIGFSGVSADVSRAHSIAETSCTSSSDPDRTGTYYAATSDVELESAFNTITTTILNETWHIYGPY